MKAWERALGELRLLCPDEAKVRKDVKLVFEHIQGLEILLHRYEYMAAGATLTEGRGECPCCGWPEGGHTGPGRYKGNKENTHEEGCSLDALLHGRPAPRLAGIIS